MARKREKPEDIVSKLSVILINTDKIGLNPGYRNRTEGISLVINLGVPFLVVGSR